MHLLLIGWAFAVFFAIHAVRNQQPLYWVFILFIFPGLGSLVYAIAIWLPEMRSHRRVRTVKNKVQKILDPGRELREARSAYADAASVGNQLRLAEALLAAGLATEALPLFDGALCGLYAKDPDIRARKALTLMELGRAAEAREQLDQLIAENPDYRSPAAHLTYARAVAALGDREKADEEFAVLVNSFPGLEARARYAELLQGWGETARARTLAADSLRISQRLPEHARANDRGWIALLQKVDRA